MEPADLHIVAKHARARIFMIVDMSFTAASRTARRTGVTGTAPLAEALVA